MCKVQFTVNFHDDAVKYIFIYHHIMLYLAIPLTIQLNVALLTRYVSEISTNNTYVAKHYVTAKCMVQMNCIYIRGQFTSVYLPLLRTVSYTHLLGTRDRNL